MAGGLPVIVTENCCVPVPDSAWRVPIMDNTATAQHLEFYAKNPEASKKWADRPTIRSAIHIRTVSGADQEPAATAFEMTTIFSGRKIVSNGQSEQQHQPKYKLICAY
jgi:hypothetical protein